MTMTMPRHATSRTIAQFLNVPLHFSYVQSRIRSQSSQCVHEPAGNIAGVLKNKT